MTQTPLVHADRVRTWLCDHALPLWSTAGIDPSGAGAWEALEHDGTPQRSRDKRLRVMPRQAFVFASAHMAGQGDYLALARDLFGFAMTRGFDPDTGHLAARLSPAGDILNAPHDLYDLAFMLLAAAALTEAGIDTSDALSRLKQSLNQLKAPRGWYEDAAHSLPRRQNPHMHLFEAATELFRVTGDPDWRAVADECLGLFAEVFLQPDGRVLEFYTRDWTPVTEGQAVEPGHMAEWVWLLDRYELATGQGAGAEAGIDADAMFGAAIAARDGAGLLPDSLLPASDSRRTWPQTELLKACLARRRQGKPELLHPDAVLAPMFAEYLETQVPGGWYDKRGLDGRLLSTDMPSSTFYHLHGACTAYLAAAED
ncbi:AGE family epimerase/isomerase [Psychromarinibacter sp. S121]|uniref:AGE family epimerase/isomerase n=1 Tax=Psychromarinibacter sp. S121 TaxID=3415127 RepID=UPI003C7D1962